MRQSGSQTRFAEFSNITRAKIAEPRGYDRGRFCNLYDKDGIFEVLRRVLFKRMRKHLWRSVAIMFEQLKNFQYENRDLFSKFSNYHCLLVH